MDGFDPTTIGIAVLLLQLVVIGACVVIGSSKGRTGEGLIFGLFLSIIGLVITICLPKAKPEPPFIPQPPPL